LGLFFYFIEYGIEYRFQTYHASEDHQCETSSFIEKVYALRSEADVCSYRLAAEKLNPPPAPAVVPPPPPTPAVLLLPPASAIPPNVRADSTLRPQGRGKHRAGEGGNACVRADASVSARTHVRIRADAELLPYRR
jgi:hypothetical protein